MARGRRLLILGGSGFLGAHVAAAAARSGTREVVVASRTPELPAVAGSPKVSTRLFDALTAGSLESLLDEVQPDGIVLCTALATIADCERYPVLARKLNTELPVKVARWTSARSARLMLVSTDLVFGNQAPAAGERYREDDPPSPASEYGRTKAGGEAVALSTDPRAIVARTSLLFGDSFGRGLGASDSLLAAIARGERPALFTDEWRTPLDVRVAASALVELEDSDAAGIVHVAGRERLSRYELGLRVVGNASHLLRATTRAEAGFATRPADVSLDTTRLQTLLGDRWDTQD